jgi:protein tyrosine/serine phosphatase
MVFKHGRIAALLLVLSGELWAQSSMVGINNFQQVNDYVYRGAQPSSEGFAGLAKKRVKTVVDLRGNGSRSSHESALVGSLGMHYVNVPLAGHSAPKMEQVSRIMAILNDPAAGPVFVHCRRGADRTGTIIAIYRISHDHWDNQKALSEAKSMKMSAWERQMKSFVLRFQPDQS